MYPQYTPIYVQGSKPKNKQTKLTDPHRVSIVKLNMNQNI